MRGQTASFTNKQITNYYARDRADTASSAPADSDDENDSEGMFFTKYGQGSPSARRSRSIVASSPRKPALKRQPSQSLTDTFEQDMEADGNEPGEDDDLDMLEASQLEKQNDKNDKSASVVPSPAELPSADHGRGNRKGGRGGGRKGKGKGGDAKASGTPEEILHRQLEKDREAFADRVLWETRVKDKTVEKMGNVLESLIDKVLASTPNPDGILMEDCARV